MESVSLHVEKPNNMDSDYGKSLVPGTQVVCNANK